MKLALTNKKRKFAFPKAKGICPLCLKEVIPKCGRIKIWHWAHKNLEDCDSWYETESKWHLDWKNEFPQEQQEIIIEKDNKKHIADIKTSKGVIELQNSFISSEDIEEREEFYENMVWLLNGKKLAKGMKMKRKGDIITFRWKSPPKSWWFSKKPIYIDFSDIQEEKWKYIKDNDYMGYIGYNKKIADQIEREIFLIKKLYQNIPCGGYGILITKEEFIKKFK